MVRTIVSCGQLSTNESGRKFVVIILLGIYSPVARLKLILNIYFLQKGPLTEKALREKATTTMINQVKLAEKISTNWKFVGRYLGLEDHVLRNIEDTYRRTEERSSEMLSSWRQRSRSPTVGFLIAALKSAGRTDLAEQVQGIINAIFKGLKRP